MAVYIYWLYKIVETLWTDHEVRFSVARLNRMINFTYVI